MNWIQEEQEHFIIGLYYAICNTKDNDTKECMVTNLFDINP